MSLCWRLPQIYYAEYTSHFKENVLKMGETKLENVAYTVIV